MFTYKTTVRLHHTDAAGVLFFAQLFSIAHDCYEELINSCIPIAEIIQSKPFALPIIHAEADYFLPIGVSEKIEIKLQCLKKALKPSLSPMISFLMSLKRLRR